jgi:hypothetical protein
MLLSSTKRLGGIVATCVLVAVPALGLAYLGSDLLSPALASEDASVGQAAASPLVFDAPAATVAGLRLADNAAKARNDQADVIVLRSWSYTSFQWPWGPWGPGDGADDDDRDDRDGQGSNNHHKHSHHK